jgi:predicted ATPase
MTLIDAPKLIVFAGPNGSGKSTVTQAFEKAGLSARFRFKPQIITKTFRVAVADCQLGFVSCPLVFGKDERPVNRAD